MNEEIVDIRDLDVIYLSYDEPQREEFWLRIKDMVPWAKRVDGVEGSDAAHKAAANTSATERFIVIDGDNLPDQEFFDRRLVLNDMNRSRQFRWRARNQINALCYGNGGISCWTREFVNNMRTHENTDGRDETRIEFCFDGQYSPMNDCYSTTYPNYSARQAFRAGFREGVKLSTRDGRKGTPGNFSTWVWPRNFEFLQIWQTIGRDVDNGFWAMHGARLGTHYLMLRDWDYTAVRDFESLNRLWELHQNDDEAVSRTVSSELSVLGLEIPEFDSDQSKFFKHHLAKRNKNVGIMTTEKETRNQ